jgi:hypothetical protein
MPQSSVVPNPNEKKLFKQLLAGLFGSELPDLHPQLPDFSFLGLDRFDQQGRQSGVVHTLNFMRLRVVRDHFGHDLINILGQHTYFALSIVLALVGNSLETFNLLQRSFEGLNVVLEAARTAGSPGVGQGRPTGYDFQSIARGRRSDTYATNTVDSENDVARYTAKKLTCAGESRPQRDPTAGARNFAA